MSELGKTCLLDALDLIESGKSTYTKQDESKMSHYPMLDKDSGLIDFRTNCKDIVNLVRGLNPWPVAFVYLDKEQNLRLKVYKASVYSDSIEGTFANGDIVYKDSKKGLVIKCADGYVSFDVIQSAGTKAMNAKDYLRGRTIQNASF